MWIRVFSVIFFAAVFKHIFDLIKFQGYEKTIYNHKPGECDFVKGIESGSEDLQILSDGIVLISAGYLDFKDRVEGASRGHLYAYNINRHDDGAKELNIKGNYNISTLHPHGLSAYEDVKSGKTVIFGINHHPGFDTVDVFEFYRNPMSLSYLHSVRDPQMSSINDLVAVGSNEFYVTNEAYSLNPRLRYIEDRLLMRTGCIVFCDVTGCRQASDPINKPNGIALSRDGKYLYVNQVWQRRVLIYERNPADNSLKGRKPVQAVDLGTSPDNVNVDESGDLWLGCLPVIYKVRAGHTNPDLHIPAQVIRVKLGSDSPPHQSYELNEVYSEDGRNVSMSTVAVYHKNILLIGTLRKKMMRCIVEAA